MRPESTPIDPVLTEDERDELRHLDYLSARVSGLLDSGAITAESHAAIDADRRRRRDAIERHGRYQAAIGRARALAKGRPGDALSWAETCRELDPSQAEAWALAVDLLWRLERDDEAVALCAEAAGHFPQLEHKSQLLVARLAERAEARRVREEQALRERELADRLAAARLALGEGRDTEAVDLCREVLAAAPGRIDALQTSAYALQRLGRLVEALEHYRSLARLQPSNPVWSEWCHNLEIRHRFGGMIGKTAGPAPDGFWAEDRDATAVAADLQAPPPRWSWSSFAAEFLEEHWQKLILCLAVLLIVVSSTVGAHLLLGELLWQPAGKCALALVWTILFAALGGGLIRWGAERAGQMMLVATLIVVPIHFMLAGEFKLVTAPTAVGLIVAAVDGLALVGLVRIVAGMLVPRGPARFLSAALLLLSVGSVLTARASPVGWGWQFAAFQAPAIVFLGAVWCLGRRRWGESDDADRQFAILVLGLLGFAFLACTIRIGAYALRLEPALYAVPVMLGAIATVNMARRLAPYETDARRVSGIRFAGYVLSGLSFALALAPPPAPSALFSANTVVAALLGFTLYAAALQRERHPAFLYLSLAALMAARVGAHYFLAERIRIVIDVLRRFLGYEHQLPWAYLALLGLVLNPFLAALSIWFRRGWKDERLARHCRYIGLPLAVAACLGSCFESDAATIVLSGYAVLFSLAVWLYTVPALAYGAILALCGAAYFGSTLVPGVTVAGQALTAAALAWLFRGFGRSLRRIQVGPDLATPWMNASRVLAPIAIIVATAYTAAQTSYSPSAAAAFLLCGTLALIGTVERPRTRSAGLVLLCFVEFTICGLSLVTGGRPHPPGTYGLLLACDGLALLAVAGVLARMRPTEGSSPSGAAEVFLTTLARFVIGLTLIADYLAFTDSSGTWVPSVVWLLGAPALLGTTRRIRDVSLVYLGIAQLVAGVLALSLWAAAFAQAGMAVGWLAVTAAALAVALWLVGTEARRRGLSDFYVAPCLNASLGLTALVLVSAIGSRLMIRDAYRFGVLALTMNAAATLLLSNTWRRYELTYAAILHVVVATYIVLFSVGRNDPRMAFVLGLAAVIEAIVFWGLGFACERIAAGRLRPYSLPLYHATVGMTLFGILLSDRSTAALALAALAFLLTVKSLPRVEWLYGVVACLGATYYFRWLSGMTPSGLMASAMAGAFGLWTVGVLVQRCRPSLCERLGLRPLGYESPLFHSTIAAALIALAIRGSLSWNAGIPWTAYAWLPLSLSVLAVLMPRAYPRREWVHASLAFLVFGVVSAVSPSLSSMAAVALAGMTLAMVLFLLEQAIRSREHAICDRLGVVDVGYLGVVRAWSVALFGAMMALTIAIVLWGIAAAYGLGPWSGWLSATSEWWMVFIALVLAAGYFVMAVADPESWGFAGPEGVLTLLHAIVVLGLWWLGAAGSPLSRSLPPARDYYPLATAIAALSAIHLGRRFTDGESWQELAWVGDVRSELARRALAFQADFLAVLAIAFTGGIVSMTTVATMFMGSVAMGLAAFLGSWALAGGLASIVWAGAWSILGILLARKLGFVPVDQQATWAAWGAMISAFSLWQWAGVLRGGGLISKGGPSAEDAPVVSFRSRFAGVAEGAASGAGLLSSALVLAIGLQAGASAAWVTFGGVGVLFAAALLHILLAPRWRSEGPVYAAQALMVGAYLQFRLAFPMSNAADAAVLTLLGYLDMGIAEALERLDPAGHYTRPTRYSSLVLPLLPLLQLFPATRLDEVSLFYLAAAAAFYATACGRLRWKTLGYAAAVFANAGLWLMWSRLGWKLAEHPQFYLVPVGLSAILFAEVNREMGRAAVNTIRTVGLTVIYVSLAMPIWRFESFGAWLILLFASLLGVFIGIGLRLQTFLWLGLTTFVLDVVYEMGRVSLDYAMAKWAIMLALGILLVLFVALNEKKRILSQMLDYYAHVRTWE
jgi:tetratricopeptide (TPR) repeat protein